MTCLVRRALEIEHEGVSTPFCFGCGRSGGLLAVWKVWQRPADPVSGWWSAVMHADCAKQYGRWCQVTPYRAEK